MEQVLVDKEHARMAIVNGLPVSGCWQCRHHIRVHAEDKPTINYCGIINNDDEPYRELDNIHIVPDECRYRVKPE
jgi:hypothetical protein